MSDLQERQYEIRPGKHCVVWLRQLPAIEFSRFQQRQRSDDFETKAMADYQFLAAGACDADGKPMFTAAQLADGDWSYRAVQQALADLLGFNGYTGDADDADLGND